MNDIQWVLFDFIIYIYICIFPNTYANSDVDECNNKLNMRIVLNMQLKSHRESVLYKLPMDEVE